MYYDFPIGPHTEVNEGKVSITHPGYHLSTCRKCLGSYLVAHGGYDPGFCGKRECQEVKINGI